MPVHIDPDRRFATHVPILIVGAGACGAVAALAARASGADVLMLERDATPSGSTALSSGFIPAGGTAQQRARGIDDSPGRFAADIAAKARGRADVTLATAYTDAIPQALDWLERSHGVPFELLEGLVYPGHAVERMHCVPERTGAALLARLHRAASAAGADLVCSARAADLFVDAAKRVRGVRIVRPDGSAEEVGCDALVLACNGFGGDPGLVERYIPEMADAEYFGHRGNDGDALRWAMALGALTADLSGYQGHGSVATPHGVLITWALMMRGAIQVNARGERFANEHDGYSEAAVHVLRQPGRVAFDIYDERLHEFGLGFPDYARAVAAGAIRRGATAAELAAALGIDAAGFALRVRGDGNRYRLRVYTRDAAGNENAFAYYAAFDTRAGEVTTAELRWPQFAATFRGRQVAAPPIRFADIVGIGVMITKADHRDGRGPFALDLLRIEPLR